MPQSPSALKRTIKRSRPLAALYYAVTNLRARSRSEIKHMGQSEEETV